MSLLDAGHYSEPFSLDPNRNDWFGLTLSAVLPLVLVVIASAIVAGFGLESSAPVYAAPASNWLAALVFLPLFPMWGVARWLAWQEGEAGRAASWWVVALIGWGLAYPFLAGAFDGFWLNWLNLFSLLLVGSTCIRLAPVSQPALLLVLPSLLWVVLAAVPGYVLLTNGWSPGFAVTVALADAGE